MVRVLPEAKAAFVRHAAREKISLVEAVEAGARALSKPHSSPQHFVIRDITAS